jgi:hypothetical protein
MVGFTNSIQKKKIGLKYQNKCAIKIFNFPLKISAGGVSPEQAVYEVEIREFNSCGFTQERSNISCIYKHN